MHVCCRDTLQTVHVTWQIELLVRHAVGKDITNVVCRNSASFKTWCKNSLKMAQLCRNMLESHKIMLLCTLCVQSIALVKENKFYTFVSPLRIELT